MCSTSINSFMTITSTHACSLSATTSSEWLGPHEDGFWTSPGVGKATQEFGRRGGMAWDWAEHNGNGVERREDWILEGGELHPNSLSRSNLLPAIQLIWVQVDPRRLLGLPWDMETNVPLLQGNSTCQLSPTRYSRSHLSATSWSYRLGFGCIPSNSKRFFLNSWLIYAALIVQFYPRRAAGFSVLAGGQNHWGREILKSFMYHLDHSMFPYGTCQSYPGCFAGVALKSLLGAGQFWDRSLWMQLSPRSTPSHWVFLQSTVKLRLTRLSSDKNFHKSILLPASHHRYCQVQRWNTIAVIFILQWEESSEEALWMFLLINVYTSVNQLSAVFLPVVKGIPQTWIMFYANHNEPRADKLRLQKLYI